MHEYNNFKEILEDEIRELKIIYDQLKNSSKNYPEGSLNMIVKGEKNPEYYWYQGRENRKYIPKKNMDFIKSLAQKGYNQEVMKTIELRLKRGMKLLKAYNSNVSSVYKLMHPERRKLIKPLYLSDEDFIKEWYAQNPGMQNKYPFSNSYYTNRGEQVRSKSEKILADLFEKMNIPYIIEPMIAFSGNKVVYPDFALLNVRLRKTIIYEHFGMMDDPEYAEKTCGKIKLYEQNNIFPGDQFLFSMESKNEPLNTRIVENMMEKYLI